MLSLLFADLIFQLLLQHTERQSRFGCRTGLGDIDDTKLFVLQYFTQFIQIILSDVVTCIEQNRVLAIGCVQPVEAVVQGFNDCFRTEVATTDTDSHDHLTLSAQHLSGLFDLSQFGLCDGRGQMKPTQKIITRTIALLQRSVAGIGSCLLCEDLFLRNGS